MKPRLQNVASALTPTLLLVTLALLLHPESIAVAQLFQPRINSIPLDQAPEYILRPKNETRPTDPRLLQRQSRGAYVLDKEDVLGVFIEGILGNLDESPPVQLPQAGSSLGPSTGFPIPVREDGTISLPLVHPIAVQGLTIRQAEQLITKKYLGGANPILKPSNRILVSLFRKRTNRVVVVRQDSFNSNNQSGNRFRRVVSERSDRSGRIQILDLDEDESDVLNALSQTGGLPGLNERSNVRVLKAPSVTSLRPKQNYGAAFPRSNRANQSPQSRRTVNIQTRLRPGESPSFGRSDARLRDGDIVQVDSRETQVYYTGGLLQGGEFLLPRDQDLDVLEAVARAGVNFGNRGFQNISPTELTVLRRTPGIGNGQTAIRVNLNDALNNPAERLLVAPGDTLILRHRPQEQIGNFALGTVRTLGLRALFGN